MAHPTMQLPDLTQSILVKGADLLHLSLRKLPTAPDGNYAYEVKASGETHPKDDSHSELYNIVNNLQTAIKLGPISKDPVKAAEGIVNFLEHKDRVDDRTGFFSTAFAAITHLPAGDLQNKLYGQAITCLYETFPHPPASLVGSPITWRSADGSGNNIVIPELGKAGTHYARNVPGRHPQPANMLPDLGLVFDTLLRAHDFKPNPAGNSALASAYASLISLSLLRIDHQDTNKNSTSSYLDLSPLYGYNQETQDQVRAKPLGLGFLYPDCFSEDRLGFLPPAASALLVIFNRNHNYIANELLLINERGQWTNPPSEDPEARTRQDEELLQTARLVNCGHFLNTIFGDYLPNFLGLTRDGISWAINPSAPIPGKDGEPLPQGQGNQVSVETSVLYRWHSMLSEAEIGRTEKVFADILGGKNPASVSPKEVAAALKESASHVEPDPTKRTFAGLSRGANGAFADNDLAKILQDAVDQTAGAFRPKGTTPALRAVEILGMEQARRWNVCTLNEYRRHLGLKPFGDFEEWSSNPYVAQAARQLYEHIDNLELYPGLYAEDTVPLGPGSGVSMGYTLVHAILVDTITAIRSDRFYTTDYTPANLTSWGYQDSYRDPNNGAFGAALPRLLFRLLPSNYSANSVYGLFPFFTPSTSHANLTKLGVADKYDFTRPIPKPTPQILNTLTSIRHVFADPDKYKVIYGPDTDLLTNNYGFMLASDDPAFHNRDKAMMWHALFPSKDSIREYAKWYCQTTKDLIKEKSVSYDGIPGKFVDISRDVINLVGVHWSGGQMLGIPIKTEQNPMGVFTEQEVYTMLMAMFTCIFLNVLPENGFSLRIAASGVATIVNGLVEQNLAAVDPSRASNPIVGAFDAVKKSFSHAVGDEKPWEPLLKRLAATGRPTRDLVANVVSTAVGAAANFSQAVTQVVDFYLDPARADACAKLVEVCKSDTPESHALLQGYVREAMRLNPQFPGLFRTVAKPDTIPQGSGQPDLEVKPGDIIFASFKNGHLNPDDFPNPTEVDPTRPKDSYAIQGSGFHLCLGLDFCAETIPAIIKVVFSLPGLRRAPGQQGILAGYTETQFGTVNKFYISDTGVWTPWPGQLQVVYDA